MLPGGHLYVVDEVVYFIVVVIFQSLYTIHGDRYDYTIEGGKPVSVCVSLEYSAIVYSKYSQYPQFTLIHLARCYEIPSAV